MLEKLKALSRIIAKCTLNTIKSVFTRITPNHINKIVMIFGENLYDVRCNSFFI